MREIARDLGKRVGKENWVPICENLEKTMEREKGRVFVCIPGHYMWTFDDPLYRVLVLRGIAWAAGEADVNRFNELALIGARVAQ